MATGGLGRLLAETTSLFSIPGYTAKKEEVTATDHFYTDGTVCGSLFKLILKREDDVVRDVLYFYPNGQWVSLYGAQGVTAAIEQWKQRVADLFDPAKIRARTQERVAALKEDLMREAWKPARIEKALEAGMEMEEL
jgi:hypothetical protein